MVMAPHPEALRLERALARCLSLAGPWSGDLFRFAAPRWATQDHLITGVGAFMAGGRWHSKGACAAVYASLDPQTALAEALANCNRYGLEQRDIMPKTLNAIIAQLHKVLDL